VQQPAPKELKKVPKFPFLGPILGAGPKRMSPLRRAGRS
jgi:hypothetical protein